MRQRPIRQSIDPKTIRIDLGTQVRKGNCEATIEEYAEAMEAGAEFPPLTVFFDILIGLYVLADGFHRLIAHLRVRPNDPILVEQYSGTVEDAQWFGIGANKSHGLKRTNEDKRNAVTMAFLHPKGERISNSKIAQHVGVAESSVRNIRKELEATSQIAKSGSRIGADGRVYNVSNIGKKPCCERCGHYNPPRCMMDDENHEPLEPACSDFIEIRQQAAKPEDDEENYSEDDLLPDEPKKPVSHRAARRKKGEYVEVALCRSCTDLAAVEIREMLGDGYLAALAQSAMKILKDEQ